MSTNSEVDSRVLEMVFDNGKFNKNVDETISTINKLKDSLFFNESEENIERFRNNACDAFDKITVEISALDIAIATHVSNMVTHLENAATAFVKSLSVDNISSGWSKFADKTTAVGTLITQGYDIETVTEQLEKLNWYTDETSYNFTDMVSNISKFTAAGRNLEDSVTAMMGIANWAAASGQNASVASRAMYQLSQAMGAGYMRALDWRSVETYNMTNVEFKKKALESAVYLGTLKKNADGTYQSLVALDKAGKEAFTISQFADSLTRGRWFTSDVMIETYKRYGAAVDPLYDYYKETGNTASQGFADLEGQIDGFGKKVFLAAQEARTFADVINSVKDAVSTGWSTTFENIFGNYEQATNFWTTLANELYDVFAESGNERNSILSDWNELGGRMDLLQSFWNIFHNLVNIIDAVKEGFYDIFPQSTADNLHTITSDLKKLTENLYLSDIHLEVVKSIFKGLFSLLDYGKNIFSAVANGAKPLLQILKTFAFFIEAVAYKLSSMVYSFASSYESMKTFQIITSKVSEIIYTLIGVLSKIPLLTIIAPLQKVKNLISELFQKTKNVQPLIVSLFDLFSGGIHIVSEFAKVLSPLTALVSETLSNIGHTLKNADIYEIMDLIYTGGLSYAVVSGLKKLIETVKVPTMLIIEAVTGFLDSISEAIINFNMKAKTEFFRDLAISLSLIAASLLILSSIPANNLANALGVVTAEIAEIIGSVIILTKIMTPLDIMASLSINQLLMGIAGSVLILAASLKALAKLDTTSLVQGLVGIGVLIVAIVKAFSYISDYVSKSTFMIKDLRGLTNMGLSMMMFAAAVLILTKSVKRLGEMNVVNLTKGLLAVMASIIIVVTAFKHLILYTSGTSGVALVGVAIAMLALSTGLLILSDAIKRFSDLNPGQALQGLLAVAVLLSGIYLFSKYTSPYAGNAILTSTALIMLAAAMNVLAASVVVFGSLGLPEWGKGLGAVVILLTSLAVALNFMTGTLAGSAAILVAAAAISVLAPALVLISTITNVGKTLLIIAGTITALAAAAYFAAPIVPIMISLAGAFALFGVGMLAIGTGVGALAAGLASFVLTLRLTGRTILDILPAMFDSAEKIMASALKFIGDTLAGIAEVMMVSGTRIVKVVSDNLPVFLDFIDRIMITFLEHANTTAPLIAELLGAIILKLLKGIVLIIPEAVNILFELIIVLCYALGDAVVNNIDRLIESLVYLGDSLWIALMSALGFDKNDVRSWLDLGRKMISDFFDGLGLGFTEGWDNFVKNYSDGLNEMLEFFGFGTSSSEGAGPLRDSAEEASDDISEGAGRLRDSAEEASDDISEGAGRLRDSAEEASDDISEGAGRLKTVGEYITVSSKEASDDISEGAGHLRDSAEEASDDISEGAGRLKTVGEYITVSSKEASDDISEGAGHLRDSAEEAVDGFSDKKTGLLSKLGEFKDKIKGIFIGDTDGNPVDWGKSIVEKYFSGMSEAADKKYADAQKKAALTRAAAMGVLNEKDQYYLEHSDSLNPDDSTSGILASLMGGGTKTIEEYTEELNRVNDTSEDTNQTLGDQADAGEEAAAKWEELSKRVSEAKSAYDKIYNAWQEGYISYEEYQKLYADLLKEYSDVRPYLEKYVNEKLEKLRKDAYDKELKEAKEHYDELYDLWQNGDIDRAEYEKRYADLVSKYALVRVDLEQYVNEKLEKLHEQNVKDAKEAYDDILERYKDGTIKREEYEKEFTELLAKYVDEQVDITEYAYEQITSYTESSLETITKAYEDTLSDIQDSADDLAKSLRSGMGDAFEFITAADAKAPVEELKSAYTDAINDIYSDQNSFAEKMGTSFEDSFEFKTNKDVYDETVNDYSDRIDKLNEKLEKSNEVYGENSLQSQYYRREIDKLTKSLEKYKQEYADSGKEDDEIAEVSFGEKLKKDTEELKDYNEKIGKLVDRGVDTDILDKIREMDRKTGLATIEYLLGLGDSEYKNTIDLWRENQRQAAEAAGTAYAQDTADMNNAFMKGYLSWRKESEYGDVSNLPDDTYVGANLKAEFDKETAELEEYTNLFKVMEKRGYFNPDTYAGEEFRNYLLQLPRQQAVILMKEMSKWKKSERDDFMESFGAMVEASNDAADTAYRGEIRDATQQYETDVTELIDELPDSAKEAGKKCVLNLAEGFSEGTEESLLKINSSIDELTASIEDSVGVSELSNNAKLAGKLVDVGTQLKDGFVDSFNLSDAEIFKMGSDILNAIDIVSKQTDGRLTITPVLDMSAINSQAAAVGGTVQSAAVSAGLASDISTSETIRVEQNAASYSSLQYALTETNGLLREIRASASDIYLGVGRNTSSIVTAIDEKRLILDANSLASGLAAPLNLTIGRLIAQKGRA